MKKLPCAWAWTHVSNKTKEVLDSGISLSRVEKTNNTWYDGEVSTIVTPIYNIR